MRAQATSYADDNDNARKRRGPLRNFFTVHAAGHVFGLPVDAVQTIFRLQAITPVPLGPPVISGLVNLRGKIVTAVSLQKRLGLEDAGAPSRSPFAVAVESRGETFALVVDGVGDAMECGEDERIASPRHVTEDRARLTDSYYRIENGILPVLDIDALFDIRSASQDRHDKQAQAGALPGEELMKQILVVDDSAVIRKIARRILDAMRFDSSEANDGKEALAACAGAMPDGILLDWNMPVMDGFEFLRALRKMPGGSKPKVLFCTTENDISQIARAMHAGADEYIMKPFDRQIVQSKFEEIGLI